MFDLAGKRIAGLLQGQDHLAGVTVSLLGGVQPDAGEVGGEECRSEEKYEEQMFHADKDTVGKAVVSSQSPVVGCRFGLPRPLKKVEKQIPRGLKSAREDRNKGLVAGLKASHSPKTDFFSEPFKNCLEMLAHQCYVAENRRPSGAKTVQCLGCPKRHG